MDRPHSAVLAAGLAADEASLAVPPGGGRTILSVILAARHFPPGGLAVAVNEAQTP